MANDSTPFRSYFRRVLWGCVVIAVISVGTLASNGISRLNRREGIMAEALATFGWRAVQTKAHYPLWARSLIGADRVPNGWETVTAIVLDDSDISDDDLARLVAELKRFPDVEALGLNNTNVSDAGVVHLKQLSMLKVVTLSGTRVTDAGIGDLQQALPGVNVEK